MTTRVYTRRLAGPVIVNATNGSVALFTVPTGHHYVVKKLTLANTSLTATPAVRVGYVTPLVMGVRIFNRTLAANETVYVDVLFPCDEGETLYSSNDSANGVVVMAAGYDFIDD